MKKDFERREIGFDVQQEKRDEGIVTLYGTPIVCEQPTDIGGMFREIIDRGALIGANLKDVPLFVNHNDRMIPIARSRNNTPNSTMRLIASEEKLDFEADVDTKNNAEARALVSSIDRGDLWGMSFAFTVKEEEWSDLDTDYPTRHIKKFDLIAEISAVTWPAYSATSIYARSKEALDNARSALESARQQTAKPLDSGNNELEILRLKIKLL